MYSPITSLSLRLRPGDDIRSSLSRLLHDRELPAACVLSCAGSLSRAALRLAGNGGGTIIEGPLEIVSLSGTLSPQGPHLHIAFADSIGRVLGGHLLDGCIVLTTAEIVLAVMPEVRFSRRHDAATGYAELVITTPVETTP
ncbi:PPC domain-containing DNA-binding protein [Geobacter sp. AOG2]|uniref:PPC domain-containing DNA-binding protein n=1 Tax=Geobacter sp. AOG2 TaxID=1566347 RepID=UPI001CC36767|nr:PPC domain-containing DNA-binding protein [Geobacter sp. AOG2]GFE60226.1 DNA-binding protein [Geobacter sp. AOG2]